MLTNSRHIVSTATLATFTALTAVQIVALTRPATACPVRFTLDTTEKIVTRTAAVKASVMPSEAAPVVRGKLISIARRSAPKLTVAAARRKSTAAMGKNNVQR